MKRNILWLVVIGLVLSGLVFGIVKVTNRQRPADGDAISAANQLYAGGHYDEVVRIYEQLIAQGIEDDIIYFNLGNAYYRQGDLGRAVLNYSRAVELNPREDDYRANLELTRTKAQSAFGLENQAPGPVSLVADLTANWLTLDETAVLALALWFAVGFLLLARSMLSQKNSRQALGVVIGMALFLLLLTGLSLGSRIISERQGPGGVVIAPVVAVYAEPADLSNSGYSLTSGIEVQIKETTGSWARLATAGEEFEGWIPLDAVELVHRGAVTPAPAL